MILMSSEILSSRIAVALIIRVPNPVALKGKVDMPLVFVTLSDQLALEKKSLEGTRLQAKNVGTHFTRTMNAQKTAAAWVKK